ncbi:MAG: glycosyltransferase family 8 protein [Bacteroidales bacterium]|nr:glycosyltransferase family 8 protein [Bacteroidales bacterium]
MMNDNPINIVCATDDNYAPYCGVMLTSVFENNRNRELNAYVLIDKPLSEINQNKLERLAQSYHTNIHYCLVDNQFFAKFPLRGFGAEQGQWSIVTYYRLSAEELLPKEVKKVLYLDCDIIVDGSLGELFDADWNGIAAGVVTDISYNQKEFYERLQYEEEKGYFNAGVVFINLEYWRENSIGQQCMDYLENHYDRIWNNDQDVLNVVLCDRKRTMPIMFNYQVQFLMPYFYDTYSPQMQREIRETKQPVIIHYASELKPWMAYYYAYPFYNTWRKYKRLSPWRFMPEVLPKTRKMVAFVKRYFIWPFGLWLKKPELIKE